MDVFDDIFQLTSFNTIPLIPYLQKNNDNYDIYYLFVVFSDILEEGNMNISEISLLGKRSKDGLEYKKIEKQYCPELKIKFGIDKLSLYQSKSEDYCLLINTGKFDDAIKLYNELVVDDFTELYKRKIRSIYE